MVLQDALLGFGVLRAESVAASIPPFHEVIGDQHVPEKFGGVAFQLAENFGRELVVLLAERSDPIFKR